VYKLPKDRLYVTVFEGDVKEGLEFDGESKAIWEKLVNEGHILNGNKKDNFWEMGETGPCGPCTEIHIDLRSEADRKLKDGKELVNMSDPQVVEIWNLVFIQYNRLSNGTLEPLPAKHVDTGMGFERLCMAIQGKQSNYDSDVFTNTISFIANLAGVKYGENLQQDIAMRVIADHIRAISFTIADGQLPSNNKAGYVIRRILRRAVRYAYTSLGQKTPTLHKLVPIIANQFKDVFPELKAQEDFVAKVILEEETSFLKTLEFGLKKLETITSDTKTKIIDGKTVFELYDTFGFPVDLTALIARENNLEIDEKGFEVEMELQKTRSRQAAETETGDWETVIASDKLPEFVGYDFLEAETRILRYRKVSAKGKTQYQVVFEKTPFYPEGGGQVGDTGYFQSGAEKISVTDTKKENDLIIHFTDKLPADLSMPIQCIVNKEKRNLTQNNHSATHLLHAALKQVLGAHVNQKGSLVNADLLRFDFSHFSKVTDEELKQIEQIVNAKIRENILLDEKRNIPVKQALDLGATALFGEKYGESVRVITFDNKYSIELCGGTHVANTSQIGLFKIISEGSVAAGVRRIEAVTANKAEEFYQTKINLLDELNEALKAPKDIKKAVLDLIAERDNLLSVIESFEAKEAEHQAEHILKTIEHKNGINYAMAHIIVTSDKVVKNIAFNMQREVKNLVLVLATNVQGKPGITIITSENIPSERGIDASKMVRELAKEINGGGGGQPFYATAGGKNTEGLDSVLTKAEDLVNAVVGVKA
jgi:alanyl-tRNA synthetase